MRLIAGTKTARKNYVFVGISFFTKTFFLYPDVYGLNLCPLCLSSTPEVWLPQTINVNRLIKFLTKSSTFSKKLTETYQGL